MEVLAAGRRGCSDDQNADRTGQEARDNEHLPAWQAFNKAIGSNGDVGIWHETYVIKAGAYENIYNNMPAHGLGAAGTLKDAGDARQAARGRMAAAV